MKNTTLTIFIVALLGIGAYYFFAKSETGETARIITTEVKQGPFKIYVNATGELKAKRSVKIRGPQGMRSVGIYQTTISNMIPEGTVVKKGDFVASLDKTELASKMADVQTEIDKIQTQLAQAQIDTAIDMKEIRDEIANLEFSMQQERLEIEKNRFEPQMIIEESKLKLEKSERDYIQLQEKLRLKKIQSEAKIEEIDANLRQQTNKMDQYNRISADFTVMAPEDGMLIYEQSWNGKKVPGSQINAWDPTVAELPDLSEFISVIYVNEVDVSKVKKGQSVQIKVDAFPEKLFAGVVNEVANIGQQLRNQDAKVFEVTVQVNEADSVLRPAMTTSNEVLVYAYEDVLSIPLEAYQKNDSIEFIVVKEGNNYTRREVLGHVSNNDEIVIAAGLKPDDVVCLTFPSDLQALPLRELDPDVKEKAKKDMQVANSERTKIEREKANKVQGDLAGRDEPSSGGIIIIN
ncbi:MAG: efflux RND transporter periplasmic adaptor subunit [Saprospiraceae bacterium]|nr:efflux RND transporter periplasmic adaptor subunit [Saprospiraceae bacterium]